MQCNFLLNLVGQNILNNPLSREFRVRLNII